MKDDMRKRMAVLLVFLLWFGTLPFSTSLFAADDSTSLAIQVSPIGEDGRTVKAAPIVSVQPVQPVVKAEFYAKASSAPDSSYYKFPDRTSAPYAWQWATDNGYIPDGDYMLKVVVYYSSGVTETLTREVRVDNITDSTPPVSPAQVRAAIEADGSVSLSWDAVEDDDPIRYEIDQDGRKIGETPQLSFNVSALTAGEVYQFRVKSVDLDGNVSLGDNSVGVRIPASGETADELPSVSAIAANGPRGVTEGSMGYSGTVVLSVTASDNTSIDRVEFFTKVLNAPEADYWKFPTTTVQGSSYSVNWATQYAPEGDVIIKAVAYDNAGQSRTVTGVFLVDNVPDTPPAKEWEYADEPPANRIVGYFASWSTYGAYSIERDLDASRLTHINYAFANISDDYRVILGDPAKDLENFEELRKLRDEKFPHLKLMISVGGWTWSGNFSGAAASEQSREAFAQSAVDFIVEHGFDGVDLDWEYPVSGGGPGTTPNPADRENFPLLLQKVREKLDEQEARDGKHYLLTIAGGATAAFARNAQLDVTHQYLDYVQIMTYDIHGTWESRADFTAPLFDAGGETYSVDRGVQAYIEAGVPRNKIVMGVPFYGYKYQVLSNENNGLRQPIAAAGNGSVTYKSIVNQDLLSNGFTRYWHEGSGVPYLFNAETSTFISHDDEESIALKAQYIRDQGLGGAMAWELSQDHNIDLLSVLYNVLRDPIVDNTPPVTVHSTDPAQPNGANGWFVTDVGLSFAATDAFGLAKTEYRINGGDWQQYTTPLTFSDGVHIVEYRSVDAAGNVEDIRWTELKIDTSAPELTVQPNITVLRPPNHKMIPIRITLDYHDQTSGVSQVSLVSVTSNEPDNDKGDGNTEEDIQGAEIGTEDTELMLRAERSGQGDGRVYTITYAVTDHAGNVTEASAVVEVKK